jgi:N-hydroxyarylamine O-acetyltransferase
MAALPDDRALAYLELLGVDVEPGDIDATSLAALQRAHLARIPYENIDIYRGRPPGIEPLDSVDRLLGGRGGYCFHLNGALVALLEWLGADVTRHISGVQGGAVPEAPGPNGNHLGVTVRTPEGTEWLVDVGLGDGPAAPLPLAFGSYERRGYVYELGPSAFGPDGWRMEHDPRGSFTGVDFARAPAVTADFLAMHEQLSTSPTSGFVRVAVAGRWGADGHESLRGLLFTRNDEAGTTVEEMASADDWWGIVIDGFGLAYGDLPSDERDRVWERILHAHEEFVAGQ